MLHDIKVFKTKIKDTYISTIGFHQWRKAKGSRGSLSFF